MKNNISKLVTMVIISVFVSACGKNSQIVTGIQASSSIVNEDVMVNFKADLNLGNLNFPAVNLPILHPRGQTPIGSVELVPVLGGNNQIMVNINLSSIADLQAKQAYLPNGNTIPLIASNPTIVIQLGAGAELYITSSASVTAIGVAVPIRSFDSIGSAVGGINLFPIFNIDQIVGAAGLFTSRNAGENGFAIVADLSAVVNKQENVGEYMFMQAEESQDDIRLVLVEQRPSSSKERKINSMLYQLNRRGKTLELHR